MRAPSSRWANSALFAVSLTVSIRQLGGVCLEKVLLEPREFRLDEADHVG